MVLTLSGYVLVDVLMHMKKGVPGRFSSSYGLSFHLNSMSRLFMVVFPSEPVLLPKHLFCFVLVLDIGKNLFPT